LWPRSMAVLDKVIDEAIEQQQSRINSCAPTATM
jgi:hypothetical protein